MPTSVETVLAAAADPPLLTPGDPLIVLVSGGRDSVCLLDLAATVCGPDRLLALHVNYHLRGPESDDDEDVARRLSLALRVEFDVVHAPAAPARGNLQSWARDVRYGEAVSRARGRTARIAAGHTASDQVETVLYRLAASPGRRALLGMAPADGLLIRPLLGVTRAQTADYCRERGLAWREDSSNAADTYARNRARHGLAAALDQLHPAATANVLQTTRLLRDEAAVLDDVVTAALAGADRIPLARLDDLSPALARLVVIRLAEDAAGRLVPGAGRRVAELLGLAPRGGSAQLDLGGGVRAVVEYGVLRIEPSSSQPLPAEVSLPIPGTARFGVWQLDSRLDQPTRSAAHTDPSTGPRLAAADLSPASQAGPRPGGPTDPSPTGPPDSLEAASIGLLDADVLEPGGLTVRSWRAGDRIAPLGLGGTKSLADLFTDGRIPRAQRRTLPIVACGQEVAWVPGLATAEHFRVTAGTTRVAVLRAYVPPDPPRSGQ